MEITAIVVAVISFIGQIVLLLLQRKQAKAQVYKTDNEASGILVDKALNINKQEMENMRLLLEVIKKEYQEALLSIKKKDYDYSCLDRKFKKACKLLTDNHLDTSVCEILEDGEEK